MGRLVIADCDEVEPSNFNRQQFFVDQVGMREVGALRENLLRINLYSVYEIHDVKVSRPNAVKIFSNVDVVVEAFERAKAKEILIESCLSRYPGRPIVAASGLAGFGGNRKLHTRKLGNLDICGDEASQCPPGISPMAPRVAIVANMQANLVVELLVNMRSRRLSAKASRR